MRTKRGLTTRVATSPFEVTSNVYWVIHIDEEADWLTVSPRAAYGSHQVHVSAAVNGRGPYGDALFRIRWTATTQIEVRQGSADELIYYLRTEWVEPVSVCQVSDFSSGADGVGTASALSGVHAEVVSDLSSGYEAATGAMPCCWPMPPGREGETLPPSAACPATAASGSSGLLVSGQADDVQPAAAGRKRSATSSSSA